MNWVDNVNKPPSAAYKGDILNVSSQSERTKMSVLETLYGGQFTLSSLEGQIIWNWIMQSGPDHSTLRTSLSSDNKIAVPVV